MKRLFILVAVAAMSAACESRLMDVPEVNIDLESITAPTEGGVMTIEVNSTGIDDVVVLYDKRDRWTTDTQTGDLYPVNGWITINKVIDRYDTTRALAVWNSGVEISVAPNETGYERIARIKVISFMAEDIVEIRQP